MNEETRQLSDEQNLEEIEVLEVDESAPDLIGNSEAAAEGVGVTAEQQAEFGTDASGTEDNAVLEDEVTAPSASKPQEAEVQSAAEVDSPKVVAELTQTIDTLKNQLEDRNGQYTRIFADFENFRKRTQREKEELDLQVKCATISKLLPVIDNFERARLQIKPKTDDGMNVHKSYQGVYKELVDCLKQIGVSPMRAEGQEFDPNLHEAVMREPTDQHPEGTVLEELRRGYLLGERVLRHALVKVAAPPEPSEPAAASES